jgi:hypothetical protein
MIGAAVSVSNYDRCGGVLWCVAWCSLSVVAVRRLVSAFFAALGFFGVNRDKCSRSRLLLLYIGTALAPFLGCSRSLPFHAALG